MRHPFQSLPENLAVFCARLRLDHGFRIGPRELQDAARALELAPLADERAVRNVLRPVLSARQQDLDVFDRAFDEFFLARLAAPRLENPVVSGVEPGARSAGTREATAQSSTADEPGQADEGVDRVSMGDLDDSRESDATGVLRASYSPFASPGEALELEPVDREWRAAAAAFVSELEAGLSRRWRAARRGPRFDLRRTLRGSLPTGGELLVPRWRARPRRRPRLAVLIDGSRSMSTYAVPVLRMAIALASVAASTEAFTFSTALRRVTRDVRRAAAGGRRPLDLQDAWGGGTTIGACLADFLHRFGERLLCRDTVVIIASDGLDVGAHAVLRDAISQIYRRSAGIVWLNPLVDTPGYEPLAAGMATARPYISTLASVSDAASLMALSRVVRLRT